MEKTSVQMEQDMLDDLDKIADIEDRKRSELIRKACKEYIAAYKEEFGEKKFADHKIKKVVK